jgi:hypothetical protein
LETLEALLSALAVRGGVAAAGVVVLVTDYALELEADRLAGRAIGVDAALNTLAFGADRSGGATVVVAEAGHTLLSGRIAQRFTGRTARIRRALYAQPDVVTHRLAGRARAVVETLHAAARIRIACGRIAPAILV